MQNIRKTMKATRRLKKTRNRWARRTMVYSYQTVSASYLELVPDLDHTEVSLSDDFFFLQSFAL